MKMRWIERESVCGSIVWIDEKEEKRKLYRVKASARPLTPSTATTATTAMTTATNTKEKKQVS